MRCFAQAGLGSLRMKKPCRVRGRAIIKCPGLDSNQHSLSATTPSKWRVYQFHHLGKGPQI